MTARPPFAESATLNALDLDAVSREIRNKCRWHIWPELTETLVVDGTGAETLMLPTLRLAAVTAVKVKDTWGSGVYTDVDLDTIEWSATGMVTRHGYRWPLRFRSVEVTITHGYPDPLPDLRKLCLNVATRTANSPTARVLTNVEAGGRAEGYSVTLLQTELDDVLAPYRRLV